MAKWLVNYGHGGIDPGAIGQNGTLEKNITKEYGELIVAELIRHGETAKGFQQKLGGKSGRQEVINFEHDYKPDYFFSVHTNSFTKESAHGTETWAYKQGGKGDELAKNVQSSVIAVNGLTDRGVKFNNFDVLANTKSPAALIELAFISNKNEEKLLNDDAWRDKVVKGIVTGMLKQVGKKYVEKPKPQPKPTPPPQDKIAEKGKFFRVQLGAFSNEKFAKELQKQLKEQYDLDTIIKYF